MTAVFKVNIKQGRIIINNQGIQGADVINQRSSQQQNSSVYQVQTLSGSAASINTAILWSLTQNYSANHLSNNRLSGQIIIQQQILLPTTQGIHVTPKLLANGQVGVKLSQIEEALIRAHPTSNQTRYGQNGYNQSNVIKRQSLDSTIIVPRGQWIAIGKISQNTQSKSSGFGNNRSNVTSNSAPIWLLVQ